MNDSELEPIDVAGERFWWAGDRGGSADSPPSPSVHLMQAYDEYVVAYKSPRTPINVAGLASPAVLQGLPFLHAIFVDTQVAGFWRRLTAKDGYADRDHDAPHAESRRANRVRGGAEPLLGLRGAPSQMEREHVARSA